MISLESLKKVQKWIDDLFNDPIVDILLNNSHLTKIQAETLLIDSLVESFLDQKISYDTKSKMRRSLKGVSRGAFNRTLHQANTNIVSSIYTVLLLGYLGILETPSLEGFIVTSNKLATYVKEYRNTSNNLDSDSINEKRDKSLIILKEELLSSLNTVIPRKKHNLT